MIPIEKFYGTGIITQDKTINDALEKHPSARLKPEPAFLRGLLGPSLTWKVFRKQALALECSKTDSDLMSFAFEMSNGERAFLTCNPLRLWYQHENWTSVQKCTYEIIPEGVACKLYLDIEFEYDFNPGSRYSDGVSKLNIFLRLIMKVVEEITNQKCSADYFLDLDSSTSKKFSRHVILNLPNAAFDNNYSVGNVVKDLACRIRDHITKKKSLFDIPIDDLQTLIVQDRKGQEKLIIDTAVYTKNRHFRLLGSTKLNKNSPLTVSDCNKYVPSEQQPHAWLLASLVTYFSKKPATIYSYGVQQKQQQMALEKRSHSPYVHLPDSSMNDFILHLVAPHGRIRQKTSISSGNEIKFDIAGYRFCGNIGREHRSNNIAIIANIRSFSFYQVCYDPDCTGYKSEDAPLPHSVIFDSQSEVDNFLLDAADNAVFLDLPDWESFSPTIIETKSTFDSCFCDEISDADLSNAAEQVEATLELMQYIT